jgi:hypothetical protein
MRLEDGHVRAARAVGDPREDPATNVGTLTAIDLSKRGVSGRLIRVTLTGSLGTKQVSGDVFIAAFNKGRPATDPAMRDTLFSTAPLP